MKTLNPSAVVRKDPTKSLLPWLGALGHTFFVIGPDDSPDNIYGGWRNHSESSCLEHALDAMRDIARAALAASGEKQTGI